MFVNNLLIQFFASTFSIPGNRRIIPFSKFLALFLIIYSCSSNDSPTTENPDIPKTEIILPTLQTEEAESIEVFKATVWGKVLQNGGGNITERGICYGFNENPDYNGSKETPNLVRGSGEFQVNLSNLEAGKTYYARAYAVNEKGVGYGNEINFTTTAINPPIFAINQTIVAGAYDIFVDVEQKEPGDLDISEAGVVYGTSSNPTVEHNKITRDQVENTFKQRITGLEPETLYFIRPYSITSEGINYGDEITKSTIKKGNFTWSFWWEDPNADAQTKEAFDRIRIAFDNATAYYNNFTSIVKHVNVNYNTGTPTADANFDGWINMGSNPDYQRTGTALHEMAHTVGVGTHSKYWELMQGSWKGTQANEILKMMTSDPNALIYGDGTHFWPYGINGAHEDNGDEMLYIIHSLIIQGMKADGLPSN